MKPFFFRLLALLCCFPLLSQEMNPHLLPTDEIIDSPQFGKELECHVGQHRHEQNDAMERGAFELNLAAECEPLTTVAGCVNVCSGRFFQIQADLVSETIEPLSLIRTYDSGNNSESLVGYGFGLQFPLWASGVQKGARHHYVMISEREGFLLPYRDKEVGPSNLCWIDPRVLRKGYTNLSRAAISGHANFVNWRANYQETKEFPHGKWVVQLGDGSKRIYSHYVNMTHEQRRRLDFPTTEAHLLKEEIKANGNRLFFSYKSINEKSRLIKVQLTNRTKTALLDELHFHYSAGHCVVHNLYGETVEYDFEEEPCLAHYLCPEKEGIRKVLQKMHSSQKGKVIYHTKREKRNRKIRRIEKPEGRFLEVHYEEATRANEEDQVKSLFEPCGEHGEIVKTYQFHYDKNKTEVLNALQQLTVYHFDHNQRVSCIEHFDRHHQPLRQEVFQWSQRDGQEGWLRAKSLRLKDRTFYAKTYRYDRQGNITRITLYGNLTGEKSPTFTIHENDKTDHDFVEYAYSDDQRNLLMKKKTSAGLETLYTYLPETNLCTKILQAYQGRIQERTFYTYDENGQVIRISEDDGCAEVESDLTDITFRKCKIIERYSTKNSASFGKPFQERDYYQNLFTGDIIFLNKKEFVYDDKGREIQQKVYNEHDALCYEITKSYDSRGRLMSESNPVGYVTQYEWDENDNKIKERILQLTESGEKELKLTEFEYDRANRLIQKIEGHSHGESFITSYAYNALHQLTCEVDPYGHKTHYTYDRFGNLKQCIQPSVQDRHGAWIQPTVTKEYNILDQVIAETNANDLTTHYAYNLYGSPTHVTYPDGSKERLIYYPNGWLKQKWQADGTSIQYAYDPKGRLTKETFLDAQGGQVKAETYVYKGPLLRSKVDGMGVVTTYTYDHAGRKIQEDIGGLKIIDYTYDGFGRVIKMEKEDQQEVYEYDGLDRVIGKICQDRQGHLYAKEIYQFNFQGQQKRKIIWQAPEHLAVYRKYYHSDGTLSWKMNPFNHRTAWHYDYHHLNEAGQRVQLRTILDPLGRPTIEMDDPLHRLVKKDIREGERTVSSVCLTYDAAGHCIKEQASVMADGQPLRDYWIERSYNSRDLLESEREMPAGKTHAYQYDAMGRLQKKSKPDGIEIHTTYDPLGRVQTIHSSDQTIAYTYSYDLHNNVIQVQDHVHHFTQNRWFDSWDRLQKEEILPGLVLQYEYDSLDRLTKLHLPDGSCVSYSYDAYHLRQVQRFNAAGEQTYDIDCLAYDLRGNLLDIRSPAGLIHYAYDILGRPIIVQSPFWEANFDHFDAAGNLLHMRQRDPSGTLEGHLSYDRFNHLVSESAPVSHQYAYDSLGNCLQKDEKAYQLSPLNQLQNAGEVVYTYDANGNLKTQSFPCATYTYDALNRLIACEKEDHRTTFLYDAFGRCLQISDDSGTQHLLYQGEQEIGSLRNGQLQELRLIHPNARYDVTFAIELKEETYFPIQDLRGNICALQKPDGSLAQWTRYTAFGEKTILGDISSVLNPWRFANRREVIDLSLFAHRFYHPRQMRWLTTDPLGFKDGLNLYTYVHNHPFYYKDPDGQFAFAIPLIEVVFGPTVGVTLFPAFGAAIACTAIAYGCYQLAVYASNQIDVNELEDAQEVDAEEQKSAQGQQKKPPVRTEPRNLEEQLALEEARYNSAKEIDKNKLTIKDPRYPEEDWAKNQHLHEGLDGKKINIHYWENRHTGERHGFKFK